MVNLVKRAPIDPTVPLDDPLREEFCRIYASESEFLGNGVQSYIEAFDVDLSKKGAYLRAQKAAWYLLKKSDILARINNYLAIQSMNDQFVDKQLGLLIAQNADFKAKVAAIKEYNALKGRVKQKLELSLGHLSDHELEDERKRLEDEIRDAEIVTNDGDPSMPHLITST